MNSVNLIGFMANDPELKGKDNNVVNFRIAVQRSFKNKQTGEYEADFINCVAFNKTAEIISNNFQKGNRIGVSGSIQTSNYENNEGQRVYMTQVAVNNITFIESKNNKQQTNPQSNNNGSFNPFDNSSIDIDTGELPF